MAFERGSAIRTNICSVSSLAWGSSADEILAVARLHLSDDEAERLTVWIANRVGRAQALAGDRGPFGRREHVVRHWLSEGERSALLAWLSRRVALCQPPLTEESLPAPTPTRHRAE
jgi:hypothetical protein